jgi:major membrane immunogen (membrane-anchored lipoprotein)
MVRSMKRSLTAITFLLCAVLLAACGKSQQTEQKPAPGADEAAVRAALEEYLSERSGLNITAMEWEIKKLDIHGDHAEAEVEFRAKEGGGGMAMNYEFERREGAWTIKKREGATSPHGTTPAAPEGGALPPGHPPVTSPPKKSP